MNEGLNTKMWTPWSERTNAGKALMVVEATLIVMSLVLLAMDLAGVWSNSIHFVLFALTSLLEAAENWRKNRMGAVLDLIIGAGFLQVFLF